MMQGWIKGSTTRSPRLFVHRNNKGWQGHKERLHKVFFMDSNENDLKRWVDTTISEDICSHEQF
jgi:hypothetical protein